MSDLRFIRLNALGNAGGGIKRIPPAKLVTPVTFSGYMSIGSTLTATAAVWESLKPITVVGQWRYGPSVAGPWANIPGATGLTLVIPAYAADQFISYLEQANIAGASPSISTAVSPTAVDGALVWPYTWTQSVDAVGWGSSTMGGSTVNSLMRFNSDDGGATFYGTTGALPGAGPPIGSVNGGIGWERGWQIRDRVIAASARLKAADQFVHMLGNYGDDTIPAGKTAATAHINETITIVGPTGFNHTRFMVAPKHSDRGAPAVGTAWLLPVEYIQMAQALWPGKVVDTNIALRQMTPITPQDILDRDSDVQMLSYSADDSHLNEVGQQWLSRTCIQPFFEARNGGLPCVPHQRVYSTLATNQTNGGLVASLPFVGSSDGVTWEVLDSTEFTATVSGANVELRRATGTRILDAPLRIRLRARTALRVRDTWLEVYLMDLTGTRRGAVRIRGERGAAKDTLDPALAGYTGQRISFAVIVQPIDVDGGVRGLFDTTPNGQSYSRGTRFQLGNNNQFVFITRNAAGTIVGQMETSGLTAQKITVANGRRVIFGTLDLVAGTGSIRLDDYAAVAASVATAGATFELCPAVNGHEHYLFGANALGLSSTTDWELFAVWPDAIDWAVQANRDRVRDALLKRATLHLTAGADGPGVLGGIAPIIWMQGCAANWVGGVNLATGQRLSNVVSRWDYNTPTVDLGE